MQWDNQSKIEERRPQLEEEKRFIRKRKKTTKEKAKAIAPRKHTAQKNGPAAG